MTEYVDDFLKEVMAIDDTDYGDFMRKANLYFNHLQEVLWPWANDEIKMKLAEMHDYIQYEPSWDIPSTAQKILRDARLLKQLLSEQPGEEWTAP